MASTSSANIQVVSQPLHVVLENREMCAGTDECVRLYMWSLSFHAIRSKGFGAEKAPAGGNRVVCTTGSLHGDPPVQKRHQVLP